MTTTPKAKRKRVRRRLVIASAVIAGTFAGIYVAAEMDMARERAARHYLGDQLYTEIRGSGDSVVFLAGLQARRSTGATRSMDWPASTASSSSTRSGSAARPGRATSRTRSTIKWLRSGARCRRRERRGT